MYKVFLTLLIMLYTTDAIAQMSCRVTSNGKLDLVVAYSTEKDGFATELISMTEEDLINLNENFIQGIIDIKRDFGMFCLEPELGFPWEPFITTEWQAGVHIYPYDACNAALLCQGKSPDPPDPICGNNLVESGEECDGGQTCGAPDTPEACTVLTGCPLKRALGESCANITPVISILLDDADTG